MAVVLPKGLLEPVRRWALRELKIHAGQVVVVVGCPKPGVVPLLRELVADTGAVLVFEADPRRAAQAAHRVDAARWSNVAVLEQPPRGADLPRRADRLLLDDDRALRAAHDLECLVALLGPGGRIAAVCRRGAAPGPDLLRLLPDLRRESFYAGAAYALWGQIP